MNRPLVLLSVAGFVSGMTIRLAEPLLPKVAEDFHTTVGRASILVTGFAVAYGTFQLIHGPIGDRVGKLRAVTVGTFAAGLACAVCSTAPNLEALAGFRFLSGMTAGAVIPLSFAYIGDTIAFEHRQVALSRYLVGTLSGQIAGPLVGGVVGDHTGWRATFLVPAFLFVAVGLLLVPVARNHPAPAVRSGTLNPFRSYAVLVRRRHVRIVLAATFVEGVLFFGTFSFLGAYLRHEFDRSYTAIGLILATFGIGGLALGVVMRTAVARLGQRGLVAAGGTVVPVFMLVLATAPRWWACLIAIIGLGAGFYMLHTTLQTRATEMAPETRGAAVAAFAFSIFFGQTVGAAVMGAIVGTTGYRWPIAVAAGGIALLAAWFRARLPELERARVDAVRIAADATG